MPFHDLPTVSLNMAKKTLDEIVKKHKGKQNENDIEKAIDKAFGITERREKKKKK